MMSGRSRDSKHVPKLEGTLAHGLRVNVRFMARFCDALRPPCAQSSRWAVVIDRAEGGGLTSSSSMLLEA